MPELRSSLARCGSVCSAHPDAPAIGLCPTCKRYCCAACAHAVLARGVRVAQCGRCGSLLQRAGDAASAIAERLGMHTPLWRRLGEITSYFTDRSVLFVMAGTAVVNTIVAFVPLIGGLLVFGIQTAVMFKLLEATAFGEDELDPPDFRDISEDLIGPILLYLAAGLPIIVASIMAGVSALALLSAAPTGESTIAAVADVGASLALLVLGLVLLPLLFAVAAIGRSVLTMFNPIVWFDSLRLMGADYAFGAALFYATLIVEALVVLPAVFALVISAPVPIVPTTLSLFLLYMVQGLRFRIIGVMCRPYIDRGGPGAAAVASEPLPAARIVGGHAGAGAPPPRAAAAFSQRASAPHGDAPFAPPPAAPLGTSPIAPTPAPAVASPADAAPQTPPIGATPRRDRPPSLTPAEPLRAALVSGDHAAIAATAASAIEALARDPRAEGEILQLYRELCDRQAADTLTDRALLDVAIAAEQAEQPAIAVSAVRQLVRAHADSPLVPRALWTAACAQERAGRPDLMERSLQQLISRAPGDPLADRARDKLERHWS